MLESHKSPKTIWQRFKQPGEYKYSTDLTGRKEQVRNSSDWSESPGGVVNTKAD